MKVLKKIFAITALLTAATATAQDAVEWTADVTKTSETEGSITLSAKVAEGFHFYSFAPEGGTTALEITTEGTNGFKTVGEPKASKEPTTKYEENMGRELSWWDSDVTIEIPFTVDNASGSDINIKLRYQACNATNCQTPKTVKFDLAFNKEAAAIVADNASATAATTQLNQWWDPVSTTAPTTDQSPWKILILGLIGGLAALLTPCVWPMIPMTISFFLKKGKSTSKSKRDALTYGLSIVVIYLILGLAITMIFGAGKLNELSTNAIFNIFFFLLLVVFAISFFGAFDIKLPSRWSNAVDNKAENTSGILSIFLMAFTLVLVSFSCTGPIIGTLLVEAASQGNLVGPALGMGGFALGLAIPFSIFAFFPAMLKEMPKSGGWLNSVKVVLGFVELILSLKFLSVADMAYGWRLLDREVFVAIWIVLFILLGAYLLGKIRFSHDSEQSHVGVFRFFLATISLAFAVYLLPGLWGAPLKAVSAFVPPLETQDFNLYSHSDNYVELDDYDEAMTYAAENHKPVLIDFSGYGCVNCRNMEAEVFDTDQVRSYLKDNFVVVKLMVDDRAKLFTPITVDIDGKVTTLETVGEKWSYLQMHKFGANSQPYYIVLDNEGRPMNDPVYYDNNIDSFMNWLKTGLNNYKTQK
jgi:thiol:disulfide interchange protein DsbD